MCQRSTCKRRPHQPRQRRRYRPARPICVRVLLYVRVLLWCSCFMSCESSHGFLYHVFSHYVLVPATLVLCPGSLHHSRSLHHSCDAAMDWSARSEIEFSQRSSSGKTPSRPCALTARLPSASKQDRESLGFRSPGSSTALGSQDKLLISA